MRLIIVINKQELMLQNAKSVKIENVKFVQLYQSLFESNHLLLGVL